MVYDKLNQLKERIPSLEIEEPREGAIPTAWVAAADLIEACSALEVPPDPGFDFLSTITAVDRPEWFEVIYQLYSICLPEEKLWLKVKLVDKANPVVPSVINIWQGADLQEREIYDLMGIRFEGHPNLKRILLWDEFEGHPLRKDWDYNPLAPTAGTPRLDR